MGYKWIVNPFTGDIIPAYDFTSAIASAVPTGTINMFGGTSAPTGFLLCNGAAVSRTTYASLFAVVGTTYGSGDGSTTFNVPDFRSRGPIGAGQGTGLTNRVLGTNGGEETHVLVTAELPVHNHDPITIIDPQHSHGISVYTTSGGATVRPQGATLTAQNGTPLTNSASTGISASSANTGSGTAHNNMQPWLAVNFIIKT